jgi:hypothetical protein
MTSDEFATRLRELMARRPFAPFRVELTTGETFVVDRRDALGHNGTYHFAGFVDSVGQPYFFDSRNVAAITPLGHTFGPR